MALLITDECISCGACLPECPNEAIFETRSDAEDVRTEHVYDSAGNRIETIQAVGTANVRHTLMTYDADNQLLSVVDPKRGY